MRRKRLFSLLAMLTLLISLTVAIPIVHGDGPDSVDIPPKPQLQYPNLGYSLNQQIDAVVNQGMSAAHAAAESPIHSGGSVAVTIHLSRNVDSVVQFLQDNGGDPRNVGEDYIEAYVPVTLLGRLSQQPGVTRVREIVPPQPARGNVTSQGVANQSVALHHATPWHKAGNRGEGVKVGIIDLGFTGFSSLMGTKLPTTVQARCYTDVGEFTSNLADCEAEEDPPANTPSQCQDYVAGLYAEGEPHGTAVAEAVVAIAPDVTLYIANPGTWGDLQNTADWMAREGVEIINYSVGWTHYGSRGDGTSPLSDSPLNTVDRAVANGITWINSAGNSAQDTWFGSYSDPDADGAIRFDEPNAELNPIILLPCRRYSFQLRWADSWGGTRTDLDIYLWDTSTDDILDIPEGWGYVGSIFSANADIPFEYFSLRSPISSTDVGILVVHRSGPEPDWIQLELFSGPRGLGYYTERGSIGNPAESANPGMLAVGAAPYYDPHSIEFFSSQGPAPDGRIKPEIVGVDCAASVTYTRYTRRDNGEDCWFAGTSQASPHVAGLAALVKEQNPEFTPEQVADYLKRNAAERGDPGPDNVWGHGLAQLPTPPLSDSCNTEIASDGALGGTWNTDCQSQVEDRGNSRYYTLRLDQEREVTIDLESSAADSYLYLRSGEGAITGSALAHNDDIEYSIILNSRIQQTLAAGTYTIEATTYTPGETGDFTLTLSGFDETDDDPCSETITADGPVTGTWAAGCESLTDAPGQGSGARLARYYTFALDRESGVTITLESETDTYLYLRGGDALSGDSIAENDDIERSSNLNSRIHKTLAAGTYTIEATTYESGKSGGFTLTVRGVGENAGDPCSETITADGHVPGAWAAGCESLTDAPGQGSGARLARYYAFTLSESSEVVITLESDDADAYLYLRGGDALSGDSIAENDDIERGSNLNSRIHETLDAGTYTIKATTYNAGETGSFTLTVSGLAGS